LETLPQPNYAHQSYQNALESRLWSKRPAPTHSKKNYAPNGLGKLRSWKCGCRG